MIQRILELARKGVLFLSIAIESQLEKRIRDTNQGHPHRVSQLESQQQVLEVRFVTPGCLHVHLRQAGREHVPEHRSLRKQALTDWVRHQGPKGRQRQLIKTRRRA